MCSCTQPYPDAFEVAFVVEELVRDAASEVVWIAFVGQVNHHDFDEMRIDS